MIVCFFLAPETATAYLTDVRVYPPLNYFIFLPPQAGENYIDLTFGSTIKRISDARSTPNAADNGNVPFITHEYATMSPFNADGGRILILHHSYFALYDGHGNYVEDLSFEVNAVSEPRWSRDDPNIFYYVYANQLKRYDVTTHTRVVVRTFNAFSKIGGAGESDISFDGDHFVLVGDGRHIFVYTLSTDTQGPTLDTAGSGGFDYVHITPANNVLVGWYQAGSDRYRGIELYDQGMNFLRQVTTVIGHADVARDTTGEEVLLWSNAADPNPPAHCQNGVVKIRLSDGNQTCLISFDWSLALHIAGADRSDSFVVSTYAPGDPAPLGHPLGAWARYANEILQVKLDGSEIRRLAHHRSRPFNDYYYTPRAVASHDGRKLVYSSNYGLQTILGHPSYYSDVYLLDLSAVGVSSAGSTHSVAARVEQDSVAASYSGAWFENKRASHSGASAVLAMNADDRVRFTFNGTAVSWIGYRDRWAGIARVYIDDVFQTEIDTYGATDQTQAILYARSGLPPGAHTLTIEVTGHSNPVSGGAWVWVDAFDIVVRLEQDDSAASYNGDWHTLNHSMFSGGSVAAATTPGDRVDFTFNGTAVRWIGYRDRWAGIAHVYIDGVFRAAVDTYAATDQAQAVMYTLSGLPPGTHTLAIEVTGRRNPASGGAWIWLDAFEVPPGAP